MPEIEKPHIIVTGNPIDGLHFIGPFESAAEATDAAATFVGDWWIAPLEPEETIYKNNY